MAMNARLIFITSALFMLISSSAVLSLQNAKAEPIDKDVQVSQELASALEGIRGAESAGADVSDLEKNYNEALRLLEQSNANSASCSSPSQCLQLVQARELLSSVIRVSSEARDNAAGSFISINILTVLVAAISSAGIAFVSIFIARQWKLVLARRFLRTEVWRKDR